MAGFLIPDHYIAVKPSYTDEQVASIIWGFTLAVGLFSGRKAGKQTWAQWKRSRRAKPYVLMIWAEWLASMIIGVLAWCFIRGIIPPRFVASIPFEFAGFRWLTTKHSFWIFFFLRTTHLDRKAYEQDLLTPQAVSMWVIQIQCICAITINRISLLMVNRRAATKMRWVVAIVLGLINISVFVIWIPAQLQISQRWQDINYVWDRIEKGIFCIIDAALHIYFIYLIRVKLISNGLDKYKPLLRFNLIMVAISMSLDVILIGSMSIGNGFIYVQFHPLIYMIKLHIEMNISTLIVRVVRAAGDHSSYPDGFDEETELRSKIKGSSGKKTRSNHAGSTLGGIFSRRGKSHEVRVDAGGQSGQEINNTTRGITKVTQTRVTIVTKDDDDDASSQSSMQQLKGGSDPCV
ncbi:hypothetical protein F66182_5119 [Fusarium sp. NRRL 66182]|nr:hypothetical protein F66182_5119 [Fusarium sp. NRRL 66182]